jgi:hypothetical protein
MVATKKASFRVLLWGRLEILYPERYANFLSEWRSLSGAWASSDLLYKPFLLFDHTFNNLIAVGTHVTARPPLIKPYVR